MVHAPGAAGAPSACGPAAHDRHRLWWAVAVGALMLALAFVAVSYTYADPDLWGHVRYGQDLLRTGDPRRADVYSYLSGEQPWINHEWLTELAFAAAYDLAGPEGLIALKTAIGLLIVGLLYGHLLRRGATPGFSALLVLSSAVLIGPGLWTVRPHAFTYLCVLLLLLVLSAADRGRPCWLWALPPLFALWTNLHGGFLAGLGLLLLWSLVHLGTSLLRSGAAALAPRRRTLTVVLAVIAGLLATLANPYGLRLWAFLLRTATVPRPEITEWQPLRVASVEGGVYLALVTVSWLSVARTRRRRSPAMVAVLAVLSLLPLVALRHAMLFALAVPVLAGEHIADLWARHLPRRRQRPPSVRGRRLEPWLVCLSCLAAAAVLAVWWPKVSSIGLPRAGGYPVRAVALLRQSGVAGNLAVDFDWGEYALWHLGPRVRVSVDGRRETVYTERVYRQNLHFMYGVNDWDAVLDEYDTDMALVSKARPAYNLMLLKPGWTLVYEDPLCALFALDGSALAAQLLATPPPELPYDGDGLSFP